MPLDPELQAMLDRAAQVAAQLPAVPVEQIPVTLVRAGFAESVRAGRGEDYEPLKLAEVSNRVVAGPVAGTNTVPVRIYQPETGGAPLPAVAFAHAGGWVIGDLDTHDEVCRYLARAIPAVVMAVGYRLAPEHRYPAAIEDYWAAVNWLARNAAGLGADPAALVVMGDSAGGNLAAAAALRARAAGGPAIAVQALAYPVTDCSGGAAAVAGGSYASYGDGYGLTADTMRWFLDCYLPAADDRAAADNSPLLVPDLSGLPPAVLATAEFDPLADEGKQYARRLGEAGVPVTLLPGDGLVHGFLWMTRQSRAAGTARAEFADAVRAALAARP